MVQSVNRYRAPQDVTRQVRLSQQIADQQALVGGESRIARPSNDPKAWLEASNISRFQGDEAAWVNNLGRADTRANQAEASLNTIVSGLIRTRELLLLANTGTISPTDPEVLALEVEGINSDFNDALGQRDNFGGQLFGTGPAIRIPMGDARFVVAAPNLDEVQANIDIGGGATSSLGQIMADTAAAIRDADPTTGPATRGAQIAALDGAIDRMTQLLTRQGVVKGSIEFAREELKQSNLALASRRSELVDANVAEALTRLQTLLTNLQATQAVYAKISQQSLLDYLR
ncbi:flagellin-like protein [Blastomonas natatoria]|uniref:Flagellin-like protein n=1 Tax=Blastomonas natatoria TaxID=34015 RepID=A0A2V3V8E7_9SPHN|nr:flagellin [Blastomonas natatoria]PXW78056.1 flagellin-like protein [Blastomonas natatoria]